MSQDRADVVRLVGLPHAQPSAVDMAEPEVGETPMLADRGGGRAGLDLGQRLTRRLTRRSLLRVGAAASAGTLVGIRPWATAAAAAGGPALHLRRSSYTGLTGQSFTLASRGTLRLLSVSDVAGAAVKK